MEVTSHNIANVSTPGYSRQSVLLGTPIPEDVTPGQVGRGVDAKSITRQNDAFLAAQTRRSASEEGRLQQLTTTLGALEGVFNEPGDSGLSASVSRMFGAFQDLATNPESVGMRRAVVEEMRSFASTLNGMADSLQGLYEDVRGEFDITVKRINQIFAEIATLNDSIEGSVVTGNHPNDLLDQRDRLLQEASGYLDLRVRIEARTQVAYVEAGGRLLVDAKGSVSLISGTASDRLALRSADSGETIPVNSGKLGALSEMYDDYIPGLVARVDEIAVGIARSMNALHSTGVSADHPVSYHLSDTIISGANITLDLDDPAQTAQFGSQGVDASYLPSFTDAAGNPVARNLDINIVDQATGVASKYILRYDPGVGPIAATRSIQNLVDAINTGSAGGFTVHGPDGVGSPIADFSAQLVSVDGGVRLLLEADDGYSVDFTRALDTQPSAEARNAATWTPGAPTVDLGGRYSGGHAYNPAQPWTMTVLSSGIVGDTVAPPQVRFDWIENVAGSPVSRSTTLTLGQGYGPGQDISIGDGVTVAIGSGTLVAGDSLELIVDGTPDAMGILGGLGINTLFTGGNARDLQVASALLAEPGRLAVSQSRAVGDNSNVLDLIEVRRDRIFESGTTAMDDHIAATMAGLGSEKELADRLSENQAVIRQALDRQRDSISGVSIDEEVGLLLLQQQAYTAAARVISMAQENIRTLLDIFN